MLDTILCRCFFRNIRLFIVCVCVYMHGNLYYKHLEDAVGGIDMIVSLWWSLKVVSCSLR